MSLLPEDADYLERVQAFFLAFRGDGVALSPLDGSLLKDWKEQGVPYEVVCRGIRAAAEHLLRDARQGARVRTLRSCRLAVEREFKRYQGLSAGKPSEQAEPVPPEDFAQERLKKARRKAARELEAAGSEAHRRALGGACAALRADSSDPRVVARLIARAEEAMGLLYLRALPAVERRACVREAWALAGPRPPTASRASRRDCLRACLVAVSRARGSLPPLG